MATFVDHYKSYDFELMLFVLMNVPSKFLWKMNVVLQDFPFVKVFFRDVVIFSSSVKERMKNYKHWGLEERRSQQSQYLYWNDQSSSAISLVAFTCSPLLPSKPSFFAYLKYFEAGN